jgi:putative restriction endonuclease
MLFMRIWGRLVRAFIGVTDKDWFAFLSEISGVDEVNFWQPSGGRLFKALSPGEPFLFKLHSPQNYIVGGGFFAHSTVLPSSLAWNAFGEKNGASSLIEMRKRIEKYRRTTSSSTEDYQIGCIILEQPFFFTVDKWIPTPNDWSSNIVQGKGYDLTIGAGKTLWDQVRARLAVKPDLAEAAPVHEISPLYGSPITVLPRLGQGSFRIVVTDAYSRRCAITQERTLPALEVGHIKPFSESGPHKVSNGILLRSDLHRLLDAGYVTVTPDYHFEVSRKIRDEFENGRDYYSMNGRPLLLPLRQEFRPAREFITWHNNHVYRG